MLKEQSLQVPFTSRPAPRVLPFIASSLRLCILVAFSFLLAALNCAAQVVTYQYDNARTGQNTGETILTPSNVNVNQFGKLFALSVPDGAVYAQPLYVANLAIAGGTHNVIFVVTEGDTVYAFDADSNTGANSVPLWKASMVDTMHGATAGETPLNSSTTIGCDNINPLIGITSTPVIDLSTGTMYVEAKSVNAGVYYHRLHALDIATGNEKPVGPVVIKEPLNFIATFDSLHHLNRPALLLMSGTVFVAFGSHCDFDPYHGWVFAYDATTLAQKSVFVTTPVATSDRAAIWMSGEGPAADASGNIYFATGNGTFSQGNPLELGDSIVKLNFSNGALSLADYFTPYNQGNLNTNDGDLGSGGVLLLPDQPGTYPHLLLQAGKEGRIYLINRDQLTSNPQMPAQTEPYCGNCGSDPQIVQESSSGQVGGMWSSPAYWNNTVYFWGNSSVLKAVPLSNGKFDFSHITSSTYSFSFPGATPSISANGNSNGIVWSIDSSKYGTPGPTAGPAVLHALDATNIAKELWNSTQAQSPIGRDKAGNAVKFTVPRIAAGKVYIGTASEVDVYGLLVPVPSITATGGTPQSATINQPFATQLQATLKDALNNPMVGVTVTFTAPASGASGTFAGGVNTATTDALGVATAPVFTANSTAGPYTVTASASGVNTPANFSLTNLAGAPASIAATAGTPQSAAINTTFATQLQATVKDASNNPVNGVTVTFTVPASGASGTFAGGVNTATTNTQGIATAPVFTANGTVGGPYTVTASVGGVGTQASFSLTNVTPPPISVVQAAQNFSASSNTSITVPISTTAGNLLVVYCMQGGSNTATVTISDSASQAWTQTTSGYASSASTNRSAMFYKLNSAAVTSVTVTWTASANNIGAIVYEIKGADINSPADGSVNSSLSGSGITSLTSGSLTTTNASDILIYGARSQSNETMWTAGIGYTIPTNGTNTRQGMEYKVVPSTQSGVTTSMSWNSGTPGAAGIFAAFKVASGGVAGPTITATGGTPQSAAINMAFAAQLQATLKDASNNPVNGMIVTFTAPASGASGTFAGGVNTATTDALGIATAPVFTANSTVGGPYIVTASAGVATPANFSLTNLAGAPASIAPTAGTPQTAVVNTPFPIQLQVTVKDASNNPVNGVTVTFAAPVGGASGTFAGGMNTATTNVQGVATAAVFTANGTSGGPYTVTASVAGVANLANFSLTNLAPLPFAVVQAAQNFSASSNTSITVPISTTAGNLLVVYCMQGGSNTATVTISDSASQAWTQTTSGYASSASTNRSAMFYKMNSAAVTSVTVTWTASANNIGAIVYEIKGADISSPTDGSVNSSLSGSGITSLTSGSLTTNASDILIYGARSQSNETAWTAGTGYTIPANGSNTRQGMQYEIVSSTQSGVTTSMSWNSGTPGAAGIFAAFKVASSVGTAATVTATAGSGQSTTISTAFGTALKATVTDGLGNPVPNSPVTFSALTSGASGTFPGSVASVTVNTDSSGVATAPTFTANATAGGPYTVTAKAGAVGPANFSLTNT
ncbi:MAG TPA: hypothetical protein VGT24_10735, partial [Candidatus Acidoferrales bacterium]|nr:hypothetical protein [Candidatus Acidoferrales bacterium]